MRAIARRLGLLAVALVVSAPLGMQFVPLPAAAATTTCQNPATGHAAIPAPLGTSVVKTGATNDTWYVCPTGTPTGKGVLDISVTITSGSQDFYLCVDGIPDTSALGTTQIGRQSHVRPGASQRIGFYDLRYPEYVVQILMSNGPPLQGFSCGANPAGATAGNYTMTVKYSDSPPAAAGNGFAYTTKHLPRSNPSPSQPGGGEPSIAVDRLHGDRVYISTPVGVPSGANCAIPLIGIPPMLDLSGCQGTNFWFSLDAGSTFTFCQTSFRNGGGDSTLAIDTTGSIYAADLGAVDLPTGKLASTGPNAPPTPARDAMGSCNIPDTTPTGFIADRQWLATYLPDPSQGTGAAKVYLSYNGLASSLPNECIGVNGAAAWLPTCPPMITDPTIIADGANNAVNGNQLFDSKGTIHSVFSTSTAGDQGPGAVPIHNIYVASSANGAIFTVKPVYISAAPGSAGADTNIYRLFPVLAIDRKDNMYVVWPETKISTGLTVVKMTSSTDGGDHWSVPVVVNSPDLKSNVLPWIVGGDDGKVDIVWIANVAPDLNDVTGTYNVYMAQSVDAHSANPRFLQSRVTPDPIRYAAMCFKGTLCLTDGDNGRILLDFMTVDLDSKGMANITYANAGPDTAGFTAVSGLQPYTDFAKQTSGPSICSGACTSIPIPANPGSLPNTMPSPGYLVTVGLALGVAMLLGLGGGLLVLRRRAA